MTRRGWLGTVAAALAILAASPRKARAQHLLSQQEAGYQRKPNGIQSCGTCTSFIRPEGCKTIEGKVERTGWCRLYDMTD